MGIIAKTTKTRNTNTPHDIVDHFQTFCRQEDIARFMSGKQDFITTCNENGKQQEQKRILTITVAEVYQLFKNEYPYVTIGKSKFSSLRPMELKLSAMPRNVCNCIYHSNVNLVLETLHSNIPDIFPLHNDQLVKECVCEIKNKTFVCHPTVTYVKKDLTISFLMWFLQRS